jgi:hypothetical protein
MSLSKKEGKVNVSDDLVLRRGLKARRVWGQDFSPIASLG